MKFMIFAIKREVSELYYYKTDLMRRFLLEYLQNPNSMIYNNQLNYITDSFPYVKWLEESSTIRGYKDHSLSPSLLHSEINGKYDIVENKNFSCLLQCDNLWKAERLFFQPLRTCSQPFYILELNGEHYGWVSPLTNQRLLS